MTPIPHLGEILSTTAAMLWAVGVVLFKRSGESMPPLTLNLFKGLVALLLLTPTIPLAGGELFPHVPMRTWLLLGLSGVLGIAVADTLFFISLQRLSAGLVAVVDSLYAPIMVSMSFLWLGERLDALDLVGAALIVAGLLVGGAAAPPAGRSRRDLVVGTAAGIAGMLVMGVSIVMVKRELDQLPVLWSTWIRLLPGTLAIVPLVLLHRHRRALLAPLRPSAGWRFAIPAAVTGTYLAMMCWIGGMKYTEVSRAALLNQLSTIFIFVLATVVLREPLTIRRLTAIGLAAGGAVLVVL